MARKEPKVRSGRRKGGRGKVRGKVRGTVRLASAGLAVAAVTQELRRPKAERSWQGEIAKVPYDFRTPTPRRVVRRLWSPDDPRIFVPKAFGVGWVVNFASLTKAVKKLRARSEGTAPRA